MGCFEEVPLVVATDDPDDDIYVNFRSPLGSVPGELRQLIYGVGRFGFIRKVRLPNSGAVYDPDAVGVNMGRELQGICGCDIDESHEGSSIRRTGRHEVAVEVGLQVVVPILKGDSFRRGLKFFEGDGRADILKQLASCEQAANA